MPLSDLQTMDCKILERFRALSCAHLIRLDRHLRHDQIVKNMFEHVRACVCVCVYVFGGGGVGAGGGGVCSRAHVYAYVRACAFLCVCA